MENIDSVLKNTISTLYFYGNRCKTLPIITIKQDESLPFIVRDNGPTL